MPTINPDRLLADLKELRSIGAVETGVVRPALSEKDMEARRWLAKKFEEAGLTASIDGLGNVYGRSPKAGPALLIGSHSDTQPRGGWLDGALGVVYGLEIARAMAEDPSTAGLAVDVVSWQDEEGTYMSCLGSRSWCDTLDPEAEKAARNGSAGMSLTEAIAKAGLSDVPRQTIEKDRYLGYLEAHIEQGAYLEEGELNIGVVTGIVAIRAMRFRFHGEQNHAGTTTMKRRKDAATALFEVAHRINQEFPKVAGERTVWTMGRLSVQPGAPSIVPGYAELDLQFRDTDESILDKFEALATEIAKDVGRGKVRVEVERSRTPVKASFMDEGFQKHIAGAAEATAPGKWQSMPSAAGHDPMVICEKLPCAMLFIPSIGGISHDFAEDSHESDIVLGCRVLADAAASILLERRNS